MLRKISQQLTSLLFRSFAAKDVFLQQIEEIRTRHPQNPQAFLVYGGGYLEYLAIQSFLMSRYGPAESPRVATRLHPLVLEGPLIYAKRILAYLGFGPAPHSSLENCVQELQMKRPIVLILQEQDRKKAFETPRGEIEIEYLKKHVPDLLIIPVVFVWRKNQRTEHGPADNLGSMAWRSVMTPLQALRTVFLGDPSSPKFIRKLAILLRQYSVSSLRALEVIEGQSLDAAHIRRKAILEILQERRVILGPTYKSPKIISEYIFRSESFQLFIERLAIENRVKIRNLYKKSGLIFSNLAAAYSYSVIEVCGWALNKVFSSIFEGIEVEDSDLQILRELSKEGPLVFLPSHKSYVDFLLLSYILFKKDLLPPHVAAGENLNFFPFGWVLRHGGAFFIKRSFRGDLLYSEILKRYIAALLYHRFHLEFFLEGARSRSGKLSAPKFGMLGMIVNAKYEGLLNETPFLVPVSIAYERVLEDSAHLKELEGGKKIQESFLGLVRGLRFLFRRYGKVRVRFAPSLNLDQWLAEKVEGEEHNLSIRRLAIQKLAFEVCHRINEYTPLTPVGIVASTLLHSPTGELLKQDAEKRWLKIRDDLKILNVPLSKELNEDFLRACRRGLARLIEDGTIKKAFHKNRLLLKIPDSKRVATFYYKNSAMHGFLLAALRGRCGSDMAQLLELRSLLQFEFFFAEKDKFLHQIKNLPEAVDYSFYAPLLDDTLDSLRMGILALLSLSDLKEDLKTWKSKILKFGLENYSHKNLRRESINTWSISAFLDLAQNRKWLKEFPSHHKHTLFHVDQVKDLQSTLEMSLGRLK